MSEIKKETTTYTVNGVPVSKEVYEQHQAEQNAKSRAVFGNDDFFTRTNLMKEISEKEEEATNQLKEANSVPDPKEVATNGDSLKSPSGRENPTASEGDAELNVPLTSIPDPLNREEDGRLMESSRLPEDNKDWHPSRLERLWKNRLDLSLGKGLPDEKLTQALTGFNHRIATQQLPVHRQLESYAFITRPDINLSLNNIANSRFFSDLAAAGEGSIEHSVLAALDAECEVTNPHKSYGFPAYDNVPFDNLQAFVPILSNTLRECTGFPDQTLDVWMSEEGAFREQYGMVDSVYEINNAYTLNLTFNNTIGQPAMLYIRGLLEWSSGVRRGLFKPKTYNQVGRRIDYQSRIYIFKYDALGKRIINWGAAMVAWPMNDNEGSLLNHTSLRSIQDNTKELNIQFQCIGARYRDTLLFETFNEVVSYFHPGMIPSAQSNIMDLGYDSYVPSDGDGLVEVPHDELFLYNWRGYPIIDIDRRDFRWYVPVSEYFRIKKAGGL